MLRYKHRLLEHLAHDRYRPAPPDRVARDLGVPPEEADAFMAAVEGLRAEGQVVVGPDGLLRLPEYPPEVTGTLRLNPRGFGFVVPDQRYRDGDLFIPPGCNRDAITGDRVRAKVIRQKGRDSGGGGPRRSPGVGEVIEVIQRGRENFVGVLFQKGGNWFVEPSERTLPGPVLVRDPHAKNARAGHVVVIELVHYPEGDFVPEGVIVRVLGEAGRPDVETEAVIAAHGLRTDFPANALEQAAAAARQLATGRSSDREDLTGEFIFTIDPPDAKDFDDAISIAHDEKTGHWTLGVHIADVAHFVRLGTALDAEAIQRGNSVYLPRLVIPMLPEVLSNGVCSLQEGVDRLTQSAFITFSRDGKVLDQRVAATVIRSAKRLTYLEAQALIDGDLAEARRHARTATDYSGQLVETLRTCDALARILRKRRLRDGMIVLNLPEVELIFGDEGHVVDAVPEDNAFTHTIIEMFMVEANEAVARTFDALNVPILRRIHPDPVPGDIEELKMYARGLHVSLPEEPTRQDLQRLLDATRDTPAARAVHYAVLRTFTKATYSPAMIGHFALASDHYAHFTSPIRRYPDLLVHRTLQALLELSGNGRRAGGRARKDLAQRLAVDDRVPDEGRLVELGRHCSQTEREAEAAERSLREFLVMQFLAEHHLGSVFDGVVSGVTGGGIYVSLDRFLIEGMVRTADLPVPGGRGVGRKPGEREGRGRGRGGGGWKVDEWGGMLVSSSGASIRVGDVVRVTVAKVDPASRHLDLAITELPEQDDRPAAPPAPRRHKKKTKNGSPRRRGGRGGRR